MLGQSYSTQICGYSVCQQQDLHNHQGSLANTVALPTTTLNGLTIVLFISILCQCSLVDITRRHPSSGHLWLNTCRNFNYSIYRCPDCRYDQCLQRLQLLYTQMPRPYIDQCCEQRRAKHTVKACHSQWQHRLTHSAITMDSHMIIHT